MLRLLKIFLTAVLVSLFFFPVGLSFLPGPNTKAYIAAFGILLCTITLIRHGRVDIPQELLFVFILAGLVSLAGYTSITYNSTADTAYATYIVSMTIWLSGAYVVCRTILGVHGKIDVRLLTNYLAGVCVFQCIIALVIDFNPGVQAFVDRYVMQDQYLLHSIKRLYGVGASLDVAGARFSTVLILISGQIVSKDNMGKSALLALYILAFLTIVTLGSMIARTTYVGAILGMGLILLSSFRFNGNINPDIVKLLGIMALLVMIVAAVGIHLYNTDDRFYRLIRFAFEGFFNKSERGEYYLASTDRLATMYVWPENIKTWIIGDGYFTNPRTDRYYVGNTTIYGFYMGTDVGYCRFIFYFGLVGLVAFSVFMIYVAYTCTRYLPKSRLTILMVLAANFTIWLKVSTDIFLCLALLMCVGFLYEEPEVSQ